jgi:serine/threonine protein kinase
MAEENQKAPASAPELEPGTVVAGYVIDHKLGEGGMGVVYGATQRRIGKRVAIKVLTRTFGDPAALERFEQEAQFVNAIRHPNIVDVFQFGELPDGRAFFVMELLEGESVASRLENGPIAVRETAQILDEVCDALEAAHEKNVIHRDLKADNVFLVAGRRGTQIKLLDFGLAKLSTKNVDESGIIHKTRSGILVGTPAYIAPEQARGKGVDPRTDIYSLGVLAYRMLTGKLPYLADTAIDLVAMHLSAPIPNPRELAPSTPPVLARLVMGMMAKEREERPSLADIRQVLAKFRDGSANSSGGMPALREGAASSNAGMLAMRELRDTRPPPGRRLPPDDAQPRRRLSLPIVLSVFLVGVIIFGIVAIVLERRESNEAASQPPTAPEPTKAPVAGSNQPSIPAVQPTIEMEPETAPTRRPRERTTHDDKPTTGSAAEKPRLGLIVLELEVASEIEIDAAVVASGSRGGRFEVPPGKHTLRVKLAGSPVIERTAEVTAGGSVLIQLAAAKKLDEPAPGSGAVPEVP